MNDIECFILISYIYHKVFRTLCVFMKWNEWVQLRLRCRLDFLCIWKINIGKYIFLTFKVWLSNLKVTYLAVFIFKFSLYVAHVALFVRILFCLRNIRLIKTSSFSLIKVCKIYFCKDSNQTISNRMYMIHFSKG